MTLHYKFSFVQNLISFRVAQLVEANHAVGRECELCIRFNFYLFCQFFICILGEKIMGFEIFKTVVIIKFKNPFILVNIANCPAPPPGHP